MWKQILVFSAIFVIVTPAATGEDWHLHGGGQTDQRFSALSQINEQTVSRLGLVWSAELGTSRGLEATPIVEDGVIYTTGSWSLVFALDARTGK
jgi:quinohemoprotein ethanol dehydrogenase